MNCIFIMYCIYIVNKTFFFHHWKYRLSDTDNSNSTINSRKKIWLARIEFHSSVEVILYFNRTVGLFWNIFLA